MSPRYHFFRIWIGFIDFWNIDFIIFLREISAAKFILGVAAQNDFAFFNEKSKNSRFLKVLVKNFKYGCDYNMA